MTFLEGRDYLHSSESIRTRGAGSAPIQEEKKRVNRVSHSTVSRQY
jgi:hypothetical protein